MFMHDEGTMFDSLGQAALQQLPFLVILISVLLITLVVLGAFIWSLFRTKRERDLEIERAEQEVLLDLAHRGERF